MPIYYKVSKTGGPTTQLGEASGHSLSGLVVYGEYVYWEEPSNDDSYRETIRRVPTAGGEIQTVATDDYVRSFAVDSTYVYWIKTLTDGSSAHDHYEIHRAPVAGGDSTVIVADVGLGQVIAVDDTAIVWSRYNPPDTSNLGSIWLLAK